MFSIAILASFPFSINSLQGFMQPSYAIIGFGVISSQIWKYSPKGFYPESKILTPFLNLK